MSKGDKPRRAYKGSGNDRQSEPFSRDRAAPRRMEDGRYNRSLLPYYCCTQHLDKIWVGLAYRSPSHECSRKYDVVSEVS